MRSRFAMLRFFALAGSVALALAGCKGDPDPITQIPDGSVTPDASVTPDGGECAVPAHVGWTSTTLEECGLGPAVDGGSSVGTCRWTITLNANGTGTWTYSDVSENIAHACEGATLTITRTGGPTVTATYDAESGYLSLDDVSYCRTGTVGCPPGGGA